MMKKWMGVFVILMFVVSLPVGAGAAEKEAKKTSESEKTSEKAAEGSEGKTFGRGDIIRVRATVKAVDLEKRLVTIEGPLGNTVALKVDETVKNLPQLEVGDRVLTEYEESVAVRVMKPGEDPGPVKAETSLETAKPGEKPAGVVRNQITMTATIEAINKDKPSVTLKGPQGDVSEIKVRYPENLEKVKVGDQIEIIYTEALAISVEEISKE